MLHIDYIEHVTSKHSIAVTWDLVLNNKNYTAQIMNLKTIISRKQLKVENYI